MASKMWFGSLNYAQWVPCPSVGATKTRQGYSESMDFTNGGTWVDRSKSAHTIYNLDFPVQDSSTYDGIDAFDRFASGYYGNGFLHFVDPMRSDENLFNETWAAPGLQGVGHKPISGYTSSAVITDNFLVENYGCPTLSALIVPTGAAFARSSASNSSFTLLIPPGYDLHVGALGSATGTGTVAMSRANRVGNSGDAVPLSMSTTPELSTTLAGSSFKSATFFITRTSTAASTVTLTGLYAQILPAGMPVPTLTRHIPGKGHSGLVFEPNSRVERYEMADRHLVGASLGLREVQPWA